MSLINERNYKDEYPLSTITKIRNILNDLNILTVESMWTNSTDNFFSVTVSIVNSTLSTNGKGTTYKYALASAYGELMERLQNQAPFRLNTDLSQDAMEYKDFFYAPDEKEFSDNDILTSQDEWLTKQFSRLNPNVNKNELLKKWKKISYEDIPCDFISIPFYNLISKKTSYIPVKMLSKMYMSNGMCAGNTVEEALVQGISEILERHINMRIIEENITPPTIPRDFLIKYPKLITMISQIELSGNYEVIIKDCSFDQKFPVVGVVFIDKDTQSYFIKFGAHPIFEIAVERTLTELLQGQNIKHMKGTWEFSYYNSIVNNQSNLMNILVNGCGGYPVQFFDTKKSYEFKPPLDLGYMNNKQMLKYLVNLLNNAGYEIFVRDVSFLGFPSFQVIIPNFSEIEKIDNIFELENYASFIKIKKMIRKLGDLNNKEYIELANLIEQKNLGFETPVMQFLNIASCKYFSWYYANFELLLCAIYCKTSNYYQAFKKINKLVVSLKSNSANVQMVTYYKCMRDYLAAKSDELSDNQVVKLLKNFYQDNMINGIIDEIGNPESIFKIHSPIKCFNCSICNLKSFCPYTETERVYKSIKQKYALNNQFKSDLQNLLKT